MQTLKKNLMVYVVGFLVIMSAVFIGSADARAESKVPEISYAGHVENIGWMAKVKNNQTSGTTGRSLRLEAVQIFLQNNGKSMIQYRAHVQDIGWQSWVSSGETAGTTGKHYRMEAIQIKLKDEYAKLYDIYYRVHVPNYGWRGYAKNGEMAGSTGISQRIEAIQIKLEPKDDSKTTAGNAVVTKPSLKYQAHCQNIGWRDPVSENGVGGTTGLAYRLEALKMNLGKTYSNDGIMYRAHVANVGWQGWKSSGAVMGTTGQSKAIEAVEIKLTGDIANYFDIYYRMHVANMGWLGWAKNGEPAGTTGGGIRAEAIQVQLVLKSVTFDRQGTAYYVKTQSSSASGGSGSSMSISNNILKVNGVAMTEYPIGGKYTSGRYAMVNGRQVDMYGWQCCGYARYIAYKLYGCHDKSASGKFKDVSGGVPAGKLTAAKMKSVVQAAGVGSHIRTNAKEHSMAIVNVTDSGFTVAEANYDNKLSIRVKTYTWQEYVNSNYGKRGLQYVKKYVG